MLTTYHPAAQPCEAVIGTRTCGLMTRRRVNLNGQWIPCCPNHQKEPD